MVKQGMRRTEVKRMSARRQPAPVLSQATTGNGAPATKLDEWLQEQASFWRNLEIISEYQRGVLENWTFLWTNSFQNWAQLAPTNLWQSILQGWNFSVFQFTREIKGNPALETKILKEVAGYGSQLGTIMDFLEVVTRHTGLKLEDLKNDEDPARFVRFNDLLRKIERVKKLPLSA